MTRAEHLAWCKQRALEYVSKGDMNNALASMASDLGKHPETRSSQQICVMLGMHETANAARMRRFIEGFN
jgi:phage terminase small subunit